MRKEDVKKGSIYELDGVVPLKEALPLGIQHVLAMFLGNISPLLIIAGMLGLSPDLKSALIQNAMFIAGAVTLVQLYPVWKVGAKLPIVMGTSSGFIGTAKAMGALYGYGALSNVTIIGMQFLDFFDFLTNSVMMPIAAIAICIFVSRVIGLEKVEAEITKDGNSFKRKKIFNFMIQYLCPIFAFIILLSSIANAFGFISM